MLHYEKPWGEDKEVTDKAEYAPCCTPQPRGTPHGKRGLFRYLFSERICICTLISFFIRANALTSELGLCLELDNQPAVLADVDPDYLQPG